MGRKLGEALRTAGVVVHLHDDWFEQDTEDEVWLTEVGKRNWLVLTKDKWIRRRQLERDALLAADLKVFCFMSGNVPSTEMSEIVSNALPSIARVAESNQPPFIAGIYRDGSIRIILSKD